nr:protein PIN-LIKES 3-like [Ipomoea batatas]
MGIRELFLVALMPVLKTLFIAIVGLFLALDRTSILSAPARHHLNNLVFYIFFPALLASSLVDSMTATSIVSLWFIPVSILITFIVGSALGWILVKITRAPRELHGLVIGCCAAGNMGNLPVIIIPAICAEKNNPFGDSSTCSKNGMSYVALSMGIGAVFVWSYVYNIVRACGNNIPTDAKVDSRISENKQDDEISGITLDYNCTEALLSKNYLSSVEKRSTQEVQLPVFRKIKQQVKTWMENIELKMIFRPPTIATILGIIIGIISPIRNIMVGESAPLRFIESSVVLLGDAAIPSMTLIMGANLLRGNLSSTSTILQPFVTILFNI